MKLEDHAHEIGSLKHRMRAAEESNKALNRLATAVEVMATRQEAMSSVDRLTGKVEKLEAEPARKWRFVVEKSIYFIVGAILTYVLSQVGL